MASFYPDKIAAIRRDYEKEAGPGREGWIQGKIGVALGDLGAEMQLLDATLKWHKRGGFKSAEELVEKARQHVAALSSRLRRLFDAVKAGPDRPASYLAFDQALYQKVDAVCRDARDALRAASTQR